MSLNSEQLGMRKRGFLVSLVTNDSWFPLLLRPENVTKAFDICKLHQADAVNGQKSLFLESETEYLTLLEYTLFE